MHRWKPCMFVSDYGFCVNFNDSILATLERKAAVLTTETIAKALTKAGLKYHGIQQPKH